MSGTPDFDASEPDEQDQAEAFDETNFTDGGDLDGLDLNDPESADLDPDEIDGLEVTADADGVTGGDGVSRFEAREVSDEDLDRLG